MFNQTENFRVKMLKTFIASMSLGLVFLGLVSCGINQPSPPEIERPKIDSEPSPAQKDGDEDDQDNDQDDSDQDEKNDTDQDKNNS